MTSSRIRSYILEGSWTDKKKVSFNFTIRWNSSNKAGRNCEESTSFPVSHQLDTRKKKSQSSNNFHIGKRVNLRTLSSWWSATFAKMCKDCLGSHSRKNCPVQLVADTILLTPTTMCRFWIEPKLLRPRWLSDTTAVFLFVDLLDETQTESLSSWKLNIVMLRRWQRI